MGASHSVNEDVIPVYFGKYTPVIRPIQGGHPN